MLSPLLPRSRRRFARAWRPMPDLPRDGGDPRSLADTPGPAAAARQGRRLRSSARHGVADRVAHAPQEAPDPLLRRTLAVPGRHRRYPARSHHGAWAGHVLPGHEQPAGLRCHRAPRDGPSPVGRLHQVVSGARGLPRHFLQQRHRHAAGRLGAPRVRPSAGGRDLPGPDRCGRHDRLRRHARVRPPTRVLRGRPSRCGDGEHRRHPCGDAEPSFPPSSEPAGCLPDPSDRYSSASGFAAPKRGAAVRPVGGPGHGDGGRAAGAAGHQLPQHALGGNCGVHAVSVDRRGGGWAAPRQDPVDRNLEERTTRGARTPTPRLGAAARLCCCGGPLPRRVPPDRSDRVGPAASLLAHTGRAGVLHLGGLLRVDRPRGTARGQGLGNEPGRARSASDPAPGSADHRDGGGCGAPWIPVQHR